MQRKMSFTLQDFPTDLLITIAMHLDKKDLQAFLLACKNTNTVFSQNSLFWKQKYFQILSKVAPLPVEKFQRPNTEIDYKRESLQQLFFKSELARIFTAEVPLYKQFFGMSESRSTFEGKYVLASEGYASRSIKSSQILKLIEEDNFYDFIQQATYFSTLLPYIKDNNFQNASDLKKAIALNNYEYFQHRLDLNIDDFNFVFRLLPMAVEKNLCNFFNGLTNFMLMLMFMFQKSNMNMPFIDRNKIEMAIATILNCGKTYFIESFIHKLNTLPRLIQNQLYPSIVNQLCEFNIDIKILLQNEQTSKNLSDYLSKQIVMDSLPQAKRESHILLFLRLLNGFSREKQVENLELLFKHPKEKNHSLAMVENLLNRKEFADLKNYDRPEGFQQPNNDGDKLARRR